MSKWLWNVVWYFTQYRAYVRTLISAPWLSILVRIIPFFSLKNKAMEVHSTLHISVFAIFVLPRLFRRTGIYSYTKMHIMILFVVFFSLNTSRFRIMATHPHDLGDHSLPPGSSMTHQNNVRDCARICASNRAILHIWNPHCSHSAAVLS